MRRMKIEVLIDDGNKIDKESFFILDPDKIKIEIYTNSLQESGCALLTIRVQPLRL